MIEQKGNIINAEEMLRTWSELNILVSRTDVGGTDDLPLTSAVLKQTTPLSETELEKLKEVFTGEING